jgi:hypothetical protein
MIVVADSSPLHYLILIEQATILRELFPKSSFRVGVLRVQMAA